MLVLRGWQHVVYPISVYVCVSIDIFLGILSSSIIFFSTTLTLTLTNPSPSFRRIHWTSPARMSTRRSLQRGKEQHTQTDENEGGEDDMHHQPPSFTQLGLPSLPVSAELSKLSNVCGRCSEMKTRCSGGFPCER
jgi:hypothetical protein